MNLAAHLAKHLKDVYFGGNWTTSNMKDVLADVTRQQAVTQVYSFNTIATLVFHMNYFVAAVLKVLRGNPLNEHKKYSFDPPPIESQEDWENFKNKVWNDAETFSGLIAQLPESKFWEDFTDPKYGNY